MNTEINIETFKNQFYNSLYNNYVLTNKININDIIKIVDLSLVCMCIKGKKN